jgi:ribosomal protein S18 acetylase RimI-like enzyme
MEIKRLTTEDIDLASRALVELKLRDEGRTESGLGAEQLRSFLAKDTNFLIVASDYGEPAGFLIAYLLDRADRIQKMVLLYEIGVAEDYRRQGIGRKMIQVLKEQCGSHDLMKMWVHTNRSNQAAMALYLSTGGVPDNSFDEVSFLYSREFFQ